MTRTHRPLLAAGIAAVIAACTSACVSAAGATTLSGSAASVPATTPSSPGSAPSGSGSSATTDLPVGSGTTAGLAAKIQALQDHLRATPSDAVGWATLGLDYVEQARRTIDPSYYPKAQAVLQKSLDLESTDNFTAFAGEAALASARHDFATALTWAKRGVAVNTYSAGLYGALADAQTQLGMYDAAAHSVQRMVDLRPGTPSFARASYVAELRGNIPVAIDAMQQALDAAPSAADKAFADYYLGELEVNSGHPDVAMKHFADGIAADPTYAALYEGRARAEAALGRVDAAVADFADAVGRVPQPTYVLEYADYLQSLGRTPAAATQYKVFLAENQLFEANGVQLDTDATLYYADHSDAAKSLAIATTGIRTRPFLEMQDAYAWALHANGRDAEALTWAHQAIKPGMRNALFYFHLGMIEKTLGQRAAARKDLASALSINPHFNPLQAPIARAALTELEAAA